MKTDCVALRGAVLDPAAYDGAIDMRGTGHLSSTSLSDQLINNGEAANPVVQLPRGFALQRVVAVRSLLLPQARLETFSILVHEALRARITGDCLLFSYGGQDLLPARPVKRS